MNLFGENENFKRKRKVTKVPEDSVPYRPSNGTEGMVFEENFCAKCKKFTYKKQTDYKDCKLDIISKSMAYDIDDKKYPKWLISDKDGANARCLKFESVRR